MALAESIFSDELRTEQDPIQPVTEPAPYGVFTNDGRYRVFDGDTFEDTVTGLRHRLKGVQASETGKIWENTNSAAGAEEARQALKQALERGEITIEDTGERHRDRQISRVFSDGRDIAEPMMEQGHLGRYYDNDRRYERAFHTQTANWIANNPIDWNAPPPQLTSAEVSAIQREAQKDAGRAYFRESNAKKSLHRGIDQTQMMLYGAADAIGRFMGWDDAVEWAQQGIARNQAEVAINPREVADWDDVTLSNFGTYVTQVLFEQAPQLLFDAGAFVAGGVAGGGVGGVAALLARRKAVKELATRYAQDVAERGGRLYGKQAGKALRGKYAGKGARAGAAASIYGQVAGETQIGLLQEGIDDQPGTALLAGIPKAALDYFGYKYLLGGLSRSTGISTDKLWKTARDIAARAGVASAFEGSVEGMQTVIDYMAIGLHSPDFDIWSEENLRGLRDAIATGAIVGGTLRTAGDALGAAGRYALKEDEIGAADTPPAGAPPAGAPPAGAPPGGGFTEREPPEFYSDEEADRRANSFTVPPGPGAGPGASPGPRPQQFNRDDIEYEAPLGSSSPIGPTPNIEAVFSSEEADRLATLERDPDAPPGVDDIFSDASGPPPGPPSSRGGPSTTSYPEGSSVDWTDPIPPGPPPRQQQQQEPPRQQQEPPRQQQEPPRQQRQEPPRQQQEPFTVEYSDEGQSTTTPLAQQNAEVAMYRAEEEYEAAEDALAEAQAAGKSTDAEEAALQRAETKLDKAITAFERAAGLYTISPQSTETTLNERSSESNAREGAKTVVDWPEPDRSGYAVTANRASGEGGQTDRGPDSGDAGTAQVQQTEANAPATGRSGTSEKGPEGRTDSGPSTGGTLNIEFPESTQSAFEGVVGYVGGRPVNREELEQLAEAHRFEYDVLRRRLAAGSEAFDSQSQEDAALALSNDIQRAASQYGITETEAAGLLFEEEREARMLEASKAPSPGGDSSGLTGEMNERLAQDQAATNQYDDDETSSVRQEEADYEGREAGIEDEESDAPVLQQFGVDRVSAVEERQDYDEEARKEAASQQQTQFRNNLEGKASIFAAKYPVISFVIKTVQRLLGRRYYDYYEMESHPRYFADSSSALAEANALAKLYPNSEFRLERDTSVYLQGTTEHPYRLREYKKPPEATGDSMDVARQFRIALATSIDRVAAIKDRRRNPEAPISEENRHKLLYIQKVDETTMLPVGDPFLIHVPTITQFGLQVSADAEKQSEAEGQFRAFQAGMGYLVAEGGYRILSDKKQLLEKDASALRNKAVGIADVIYTTRTANEPQKVRQRMLFNDEVTLAFDIIAGQRVQLAREARDIEQAQAELETPGLTKEQQIRIKAWLKKLHAVKRARWAAINDAERTIKDHGVEWGSTGHMSYAEAEDVGKDIEERGLIEASQQYHAERNRLLAQRDAVAEKMEKEGRSAEEIRAYLSKTKIPPAVAPEDRLLRAETRNVRTGWAAAPSTTEREGPPMKDLDEQAWEAEQALNETERKRDETTKEGIIYTTNKRLRHVSPFERLVDFLRELTHLTTLPLQIFDSTTLQTAIAERKAKRRGLPAHWENLQGLVARGTRRGVHKIDPKTGATSIVLPLQRQANEANRNKDIVYATVREFGRIFYDRVLKDSFLFTRYIQQGFNAMRDLYEGSANKKRDWVADQLLTYLAKHGGYRREFFQQTIAHAIANGGANPQRFRLSRTFEAIMQNRWMLPDSEFTVPGPEATPSTTTPTPPTSPTPLTPDEDPNQAYWESLMNRADNTGVDEDTYWEQQADQLNQTEADYEAQMAAQLEAEHTDSQPAVAASEAGGWTNTPAAQQTGQAQPVQQTGQAQPAETSLAPVPSNQEVAPFVEGDLSTYTMHSGGAKGSDTIWHNEGLKQGLRRVFHYFGRGMAVIARTVGGVDVAHESLYDAEAVKAVTGAAALLGKNPPSRPTVKPKIYRNWQQVKNADAVYAVGRIGSDNMVEGGTGWAVAMAMAMGKPVYVYDLNTMRWHQFTPRNIPITRAALTAQENRTSLWRRFKEGRAPALTPNFAGIGTRGHASGSDDVHIAEAVNMVYARTKAQAAQQQTAPAQQQTAPAQQPSFASPIVPMNFPYDGNQREGVTAPSTFEAIESGERTATTRYASNTRDIGALRPLQVGDTVRFISRQHPDRIIVAEVTNPLMPVPDPTAYPSLTWDIIREHWSKLEGWSPAWFDSNVKSRVASGQAFQIQFKYLYSEDRDGNVVKRAAFDGEATPAATPSITSWNNVPPDGEATPAEQQSTEQKLPASVMQHMLGLFAKRKGHIYELPSNQNPEPGDLFTNPELPSFITDIADRLMKFFNLPHVTLVVGTTSGWGEVRYEVERSEDPVIVQHRDVLRAVLAKKLVTHAGSITPLSTETDDILGIAINDKVLETGEGYSPIILLHELGHLFYKKRLSTLATDEEKQQLRDAFEQDRAQLKNDPDLDSATEKQYLRYSDDAAFEEWIADKFAAWTVDHGSRYEQYSYLGRIFQGIYDRLMGIFEKAVKMINDHKVLRRRFVPNEVFELFMSRVRRERTTDGVLQNAPARQPVGQSPVVAPANAVNRMLDLYAKRQGGTVVLPKSALPQSFIDIAQRILEFFNIPNVALVMGSTSGWSELLAQVEASTDSVIVQYQNGLASRVWHQQDMVGAGHISRLSTDTDQIVAFAIKDEYATDMGMATLILLHELGHIFYRTQLSSLATNEEKQQLRAAFERDRAALRNQPDSEDGINNQYLNYNDEAAFEEWLADKFAAWAIDRSSGQYDRGRFARIFQRIYDKLKALYTRAISAINGNAALGQRFVANKEFNVFMDRVTAEHTANGILPPGGDMHLDAKLYLDLGNIARRPGMRAFMDRAKDIVTKGAKIINPALTSDYILRKYDPFLADQFFVNTATRGKGGFFNVKPFVAGRWLEELGRLEKSMSPARWTATLTAMQRGENDGSPANRRVRQFLDKFHDFMKGPEGNRTMPVLGHKENYYPRAYDLQAIQERPDEFDHRIRNLYRISADDAREVREKILYSGGIDNRIIREAVGPGHKYSKQRTLNHPDHDDVMKEAGFLQTDPAEIMRHYIVTGTREAEFERRLGKYQQVSGWRDITQLPQELGDAVSRNNMMTLGRYMENAGLLPSTWQNAQDPIALVRSKISNAVNMGYLRWERSQEAGHLVPHWYNRIGLVSERLDAIQRTHGTDAWKRASRVIDAYMGRLGQDMDAGVRKVQSAILAYESYLTLMFTAVASLPDLGGSIMASKDFEGIKEAFKAYGRSVKAGSRRAMYERAHLLGTISRRLTDQALLDVYGLAHTSGLSQRALEGLFKVNGQQMFTNYSRVMATTIGEQFIVRHARRPNDPKSRRYLEELGITADTVNRWVRDGSRTWNHLTEGQLANDAIAVQEAIGRFVDSAVIRPNATHRPVWASDPRFMLIWHLKSFFYSYGKVIIGGMLREIGHRYREANGNRATKAMVASLPLVTAGLMLLPLAAAGLELREMIQYGDKPKPTDRMASIDYLGELTSRAGAYGPFELAAAFFGIGSYSSGPMAIAGPTLQHIQTIISSDAEFGIKRSLPVFNQNPWLWQQTKDVVGL